MGAHWEGNPYRRPRSPFWHIVYEDETGVVRRRSTKTKDLRIAREALATQLREVEKLQTGHVDRYAETRTTSIAKLVNEYLAHLKAEECAPRYVKETIRQIRAFVRFARVPTVPAIAVPDAERFLADVRTRCSVRTRDHHAAALRAFGRWLERTGRWDRDPFKGLGVRTAQRDRHRVFRRVSLRFAEAEQLVEAAWARHEAEKALGGMPTQYD
jgi:site-specific recombinase XerD